MWNLWCSQFFTCGASQGRHLFEGIALRFTPTPPFSSNRIETLNGTMIHRRAELEAKLQALKVIWLKRAHRFFVLECMRSRIMICLRNWDSPWRGNGRTPLHCWLVKGHAITLSGIAKTVNMCKSPSSFLTQSLGGSGSQREGILPEELFTLAPVTLLIYILLKGEKEWGCAPSAAECWQAQHVTFPGSFASFPSAPA